MNRTEKIRNTAVYVVLRFLIILTIIFSAFSQNWNNIFVCIIALVLFTIPNFIENKFSIELPTVLESLVYIFIFSAQILGEIRNFYGIIPYWDTMLHTLNGFIFAGIGFSLVDLLNKSDKTRLYLSPIYITIVAILFSITIGTCWEFFEYGADVYLNKDMQKDTLVTDIYSVYFNDTNTVEMFADIESTSVTYSDGTVLVIDGGYLDTGLYDTMKDMFVNAIGACVFAVFGYFYEKGTSQYEFAKNFIPKKKVKK